MDPRAVGRDDLAVQLLRRGYEAIPCERGRRGGGDAFASMVLGRRAAADAPALRVVPGSFTNRLQAELGTHCPTLSLRRCSRG